MPSRCCYSGARCRSSLPLDWQKAVGLPSDAPGRFSQDFSINSSQPGQAIPSLANSEIVFGSSTAYPSANFLQASLHICHVGLCRARSTREVVLLCIVRRRMSSISLPIVCIEPANQYFNSRPHLMQQGITAQQVSNAAFANPRATSAILKGANAPPIMQQAFSRMTSSNPAPGAPAPSSAPPPAAPKPSKFAASGLTSGKSIGGLSTASKSAAFKSMMPSYESPQSVCLLCATCNIGI